MLFTFNSSFLYFINERNTDKIDQCYVDTLAHRAVTVGPGWAQRWLAAAANAADEESVCLF